MSDQIAIRFQDVGKMYKIFPTRLDNFLDALGLARLMPWRRIEPREFWALRDINLELKKGRRLGIIGRNGAGKSTLLKLIAGNLIPTEGRIQVNGQVQALLEAGAGFHPEFTGMENIRAALVYQGYTSKEMESVIQDIVEFTELGQFLNQPLKTYSSGMAARLIFATATALKPDILIVDEILGAGDAYFSSKSAARMKSLVEDTGASVLLVSHSMGDILRYCEECFWMERGRIVKQGSSLEVIKAYEEYIHVLEDRRLKAKNRKRQSANYSVIQLDLYSDAMLLVFQLQGEMGACCEISEITLLENGQVEETLRVGDVQDNNWSQASVLYLDGSNWSKPQRTTEGWCRRLKIQPNNPGGVQGTAAFFTYLLFDDSDYALRVRYRCDDSARVSLMISRNSVVVQDQVILPASGSKWIEWDLPMVLKPKTALPPQEEMVGVDSSLAIEPKTALPPEENRIKADSSMSLEPKTALPPQKEMVGVASFLPLDGGKIEKGLSHESEISRPNRRSITRWPSEGSLTIEKALMLGVDGEEHVVFKVGSTLTLSMLISAHRSGHFSLVPAATLFRLDGIFVSNLVGPMMPLDLRDGESKEIRLTLSPLNLGDGNYVFSVSIFEEIVGDSSRYDLIDRSYEFQVIGNDSLLASAIFQHPATWTLV